MTWTAWSASSPRTSSCPATTPGCRPRGCGRSSGARNVSRLLVALGQQLLEAGATLDSVQVNGQPGALVRAPDGSLISVFVLDIADGQVQAVRSVIARDKLRHLGPLADLMALRAAQRRDPAEPGPG